MVWALLRMNRVATPLPTPCTGKPSRWPKPSYAPITRTSPAFAKTSNGCNKTRACGYSPSERPHSPNSRRVANRELCAVNGENHAQRTTPCSLFTVSLVLEYAQQRGKKAHGRSVGDGRRVCEYRHKPKATDEVIVVLFFSVIRHRLSVRFSHIPILPYPHTGR